MRSHLLISISLSLLIVSSVAAQKPELVVQIGHSYPVTAVTFSPNSKTLATGSADGSIRLWEVSTGAELRTFKTYGGEIAFSPDGKILAGGPAGTTGEIELWDVSTGKKLRVVHPDFPTVNSFAFSPDGALLAVCSSVERFNSAEVARSAIKLWNLTTGEEVMAAFAGFSYEIEPKCDAQRS